MDLDVGSDQEAAISFNAISFNAISFNALSANLTANEKMTEVPLATASYDGTYLGEQLEDSLTQEFMSYLVGCALDPSQEVEWKNPLDGTYHKWTGLMGLCPSWNEGPASKTCRRVVSACLLGRVNAFNKHVELSFRGHDEFVDPIKLSKVVPSDDTYSDKTPVAPYQSCGGPAYGPYRECGWQQGYVGACTPGAVVSVGAGAPAPGSCGGTALGYSSGDSMLRVCSGLTGCKQSDSTYITEVDDSCGTYYPSTSFVCPSSGYYNVMQAPYAAAYSVSVSAESNSGHYPANEQEVFPWREGAFFGDIFDTGNLHANIYVSGGKVFGREVQVKGAIYGNMWACWSDVWSYGEGYMKDRVCAGSSVNCAATPVGACRNYWNTSYPTYRCKSNDDPLVSGDQDYQGCYGKNGTYWRDALTIELNDPCDLGSRYCQTAVKGPSSGK